MSALRRHVWERWQQAAGPWLGWATCPLLVIPHVEVSSAPDSTEAPVALGDLERVLDRDGVAMVLDVEPCWGVLLAAEVQRRGLAHVVLVLPRWPHAEAVLPTGELLATLVAAADGLAHGIPRNNVLFVLDGERQRSIHRGDLDRRVDNRYPLLAADLPSLRVLRAAGIQRVVKISTRA